MPEFPFTPSPARVHENARALIGHHPHWRKAPYHAGLYCTVHYRICSYCRSIHPGDMMALLRAGFSRLEAVSPQKMLLITPNPIAGRAVRMGSVPGLVFPRDRQPRSLRDRIVDPTDKDLDPSIGERLACHFERPAFEAAPEFIPQPFFLEHASSEQWAIINKIANGGSDAPLSRSS